MSRSKKKLPFHNMISILGWLWNPLRLVWESTTKRLASCWITCTFKVYIVGPWYKRSSIFFPDFVGNICLHPSSTLYREWILGKREHGILDIREHRILDKKEHRMTFLVANARIEKCKFNLIWRCTEKVYTRDVRVSLLTSLKVKCDMWPLWNIYAKIIFV